MADVFEQSERSRIMARIKNRGTKPELIVRQVLLESGIRYRYNYKGLPCKPDFIFPGRKKVIFVHGCFWHRHFGCKRAGVPTSNTAFWEAKLNKNVARDAKNQLLLEELGWKVLIVWQCNLKDKELLKSIIVSFLKNQE